MNSQNKTYLIISIALLIIIGIIFKVEYKPDVNYLRHYKLSSKDPYGLAVLYESLKLKLGNENVRVQSSFSFQKNKDYRKTLFIEIKENISHYDDTLALLEILKNGGQILLATQDLSIEHSSLGFKSTSDTVNRKKLSIINYINGNKIAFKNEINGREWTNLFINIHKKYRSKIHSVLDTSKYHLYGVNDIPIATSYYNQKLIVHGCPELFSNYMSLQPGFVPHLNGLLSIMDFNEVIFIFDLRSVPENQSLLETILSKPGLKWAFYLFIIGVLLLLIVNTKRKQPVIKILPENKNNTLAYVDILSKVYQKGSDLQALKRQIGDNFFTYVYSEYYLKQNQDNFIQLLIRKSKANSELVESIVSRINKKDSDNLNSKDIITLHNNIKKFKDSR